MEQDKRYESSANILGHLLDKRKENIELIREAQFDQREAETAIKKLVVDEGLHECLTINYQKLSQLI